MIFHLVDAGERFRAVRDFVITYSQLARAAVSMLFELRVSEFRAMQEWPL